MSNGEQCRAESMTRCMLLVLTFILRTPESHLPNTLLKVGNQNPKTTAQPSGYKGKRGFPLVSGWTMQESLPQSSVNWLLPSNQPPSLPFFLPLENPHPEGRGVSNSPHLPSPSCPYHQLPMSTPTCSLEFPVFPRQWLLRGCLSWHTLCDTRNK